MSTTPTNTPKQDAKAALDKLSAQRRKFVLAYCETFNATKAALSAGYSKKTARTQGSQLLTILDIKAAIKAVMSTASMEPEEIAARWTNLARAGIGDFYTKVAIQEVPKVQQSLVNAITDIEADIEHKYDFMVRSWDVLELGKDDRAKELAEHDKWTRFRKLDILRHQMALERNPAAVRLIDGPPVTKYVMQLDLVKAADLGLLDLVKAITPTMHGDKVELRSPDEALGNLAKHLGMLTSKVDVTSGGEKLPSGVVQVTVVAAGPALASTESEIID